MHAFSCDSNTLRVEENIFKNGEKYGYVWMGLAETDCDRGFSRTLFFLRLVLFFVTFDNYINGMETKCLTRCSDFAIYR